MNPELPHLKALPGVRSANEERANRVGLAGNSGWHRERQKDARDLEALQLDGIEMSYGQFRTYVWRIRKKGVPTTVRAVASASVTASRSDARSQSPQTTPSSQSTVGVRDRLANIRESERSATGSTTDRN
jgi:hypothetical protein